MRIEMTEKLKVWQSGVETIAMRSCVPPRWRDCISFQGSGDALSLMAGFGHWAPSITYDHLGFCLYCALELLKCYFSLEIQGIQLGTEFRRESQGSVLLGRHFSHSGSLYP